MSRKLLLRTENLSKTYSRAGEDLTIFDDVAMEIRAGEIVALVGPSGAGKSTLLQLIGLLDRPSGGQILVAGRDVSALGDEERTLLRRHYIGFVYQFHFLQPEFSAVENVMMPQIIAGESKGKAKEKAEGILAEMGLSHRLDHRPGTLSGGEQQRVAIARALANDARLLLADEPTGNLDPKTSEDVFDLLIERVRVAGIGAVIATHNMDLAARMDRVLEMRQGKLRVY